MRWSMTIADKQTAASACCGHPPGPSLACSIGAATAISLFFKAFVRLPGHSAIPLTTRRFSDSSRRPLLERHRISQRSACDQSALDERRRPSVSRRRCVRVVGSFTLLERGRRESRVSTDTRGPRAAKSTRQNHRLSQHPAFPAQWFERLLRALPGDRLCCPRHVTRRAERIS